MKQKYSHIIESCRECASECKACAAAIKDADGMQSCIKIALECAMICELCVSLGENNSGLFPKSLELAMDACLSCIHSCEDIATDVCKKCAWQCRKSTVDFLSILE